MKRIRYLAQRFFQWMFHILFIVYIISVTQHSIAESTLDTPVTMTAGSGTLSSKAFLQQTEEYSDPPNKPREALGTLVLLNSGRHIQSLTNMQLVLCGGVFIIVGTFLVSSVFFPSSGYHHGFLWLFGDYTKTAETIFRYLPHSDTCTLPDAAHAAIPLTLNKHFLSEDEASAERIAPYILSLREDNIFSSHHVIIKRFFQQCGLTFTAISDTELRLNTQNTIYASYGEIPVYIVHNAPLNSQHIHQIYNRANNHYQQFKNRLAFMILITALPENWAYYEIYNYKEKYNFTLIPVSYLLITKAVRYSVGAQELENMINIATGLSNRYELHTPVVNPLQFFGRTDIIDYLIDAVGRRQHISLCGLRKIGKTSLIWQCKIRLTRHIVAYIDLQQIPMNCAYLARQILAECIADIKFKYPSLVLPKLRHINSNDTERYTFAFIEDLVRLWQCLSEQTSEIKIVLLLDEAEQLIPSGPDTNDGFFGFREFLGVIRGISQQYGFLVSVMISTHPEIARTDIWQTKNNPGFQYYQEIFLSSLSEQECDQMIISIGAQMGLIYTEESLSRIYYETGGHPYVTRQLCGLIVEHLGASNFRFQNSNWEFEIYEPQPAARNTVQVQDVENAVSAYIEHKSDYLESIWQRLSHIEQEILLVVATNDTCALNDLITEEHSYQEKRERRKAISRLIENSMLEKCEDKYSLTMGLLERFILTNT